MADYTTQEVVTESVLLSAPMLVALAHRGGSYYAEGDEGAVLDSLVAGVELHSYSVVFESGWQEIDPDEPREYTEEVKALIGLDKHEFFREVLKINPKQEYIELQAGWTCSRMRKDGFGGSSLHVTRKGYLYVTTTAVVVEADGTCKLGYKFVRWKR